MKSYGDQLREARERAGFTRVQAANCMRDDGFDVNNSYISRWENGYNNPSLGEFIELCEIYGIHDVGAALLGKCIGSGKPVRGLNQRGLEALSIYRDELLASGLYADANTKVVVEGRYQSVQTRKREREENARGTERGPDPIRGRYPDDMLKVEAYDLRPEGYDGDDVEEYHRLRATGIPLHTYVPCYDLPASAGTGNMIDSQDFETIPVPKHLVNKVEYAVHVDGDSMEPVLADGELLFVHAQPELRDGEVGIFTLNGVTYVKQLRTVRSGTYLVSANEAYAPIRVAEYDTLRVQGKVVSPSISPREIRNPFPRA